MREFLSRVFRLRPEEMGLVFVLGFVLLSNALARQVTGIAAISGLLSEGGVNQILLVWLVDYAIILFTGGLQSLVVDRVDRTKLMKWITLGLMLIFVLIRLMFYLPLPAWLNYAVLYIVAEQQYIFFPLVFWILANDVFDMAQAKRLFPFISSWNYIGVIIGTLIAALCPSLFQQFHIASENILMLNVLIYGAVLVCLFYGLRKVHIRETTHKHEKIRETLVEGWGFVREVLSFRYLMLAMVILALCDTIIEFRFLNVTNAVFPTHDAYQRFYSLYRMGVTVLAFIIQSLLTSRIIQKFTLKNTFFLFPALMLIGVLGMAFIPGLGVVIFTFAFIRLARDTVDESSRKAFQALVPEERRGRVSTFMDSYLPAIGTIVACIITGAIVLIGNWLKTPYVYYIYLGVALVGSVCALWMIFRVRSSYDTSMLNWRLKRRQRAASILDKLDF